jgi:hypothetical protein
MKEALRFAAEAPNVRPNWGVRMTGVPRAVGSVLVACMIFTTVVASTGCARQDAPVGNPAAPDVSQQFLGPYPMGVAVGVGQARFTLESVEVSDLEWPYQDASSAAPKGSKWVYVTFSFEGTGTNPAPAAGYFDSHFQLIADGNSVPIDIRSSGGDMEAPPRTLPRWSMSFQAPEDARSLVLQVTPMLAGAHTVAFRLW